MSALDTTTARTFASSTQRLLPHVRCARLVSWAPEPGGAGIAISLASAGFAVRLLDTNAQAVASGRPQIYLP